MGRNDRNISGNTGFVQGWGSPFVPHGTDCANFWDCTPIQVHFFLTVLCFENRPNAKLLIVSCNIYAADKLIHPF